MTSVLGVDGTVKNPLKEDDAPAGRTEGCSEDIPSNWYQRGALEGCSDQRGAQRTSFPIGIISRHPVKE